MTNKSKNKGTTFETDVVNYLNEQGIRCERRSLNGINDRGDITVYDRPSLVLECKSEAKFDLAGYMKEVAVEVVNAGNDMGVAIVKAPRKNVSQAYVVMPLEVFVKKVLKR